MEKTKEVGNLGKIEKWRKKGTQKWKRRKGKKKKVKKEKGEKEKGKKV